MTLQRGCLYMIIINNLGPTGFRVRVYATYGHIKKSQWTIITWWVYVYTTYDVRIC